MLLGVDSCSIWIEIKDLSQSIANFELGLLGRHVIQPNLQVASASPGCQTDSKNSSSILRPTLAHSCRVKYATNVKATLVQIGSEHGLT